MTCNIKVENSPTVMTDHKKAVEKAKCYGRNSEEIHSGDGFTMVSQEREPTLGWFGIPRRASHPTRDGSLGNIEPEHLEFAMDARCTLGWVLLDHTEDQIANFFRDCLPAKHAACSGDRTPIEGESCQVPPDHSVRGHDDQRLFPSGPKPLRKNPEELIERSNPWPGTLALEHSELLPKNEVFEQKVPTSTEDPEHCSS